MNDYNSRIQLEENIVDGKLKLDLLKGSLDAGILTINEFNSKKEALERTLKEYEKDLTRIRKKDEVLVKHKDVFEKLESLKENGLITVNEYNQKYESLLDNLIEKSTSDVNVRAEKKLNQSGFVSNFLNYKFTILLSVGALLTVVISILSTLFSRYNQENTPDFNITVDVPQVESNFAIEEQISTDSIYDEDRLPNSPSRNKSSTTTLKEEAPTFK